MGLGNIFSHGRITKTQKELKAIAKAGPVPALGDVPAVKGSQLRKPNAGDDKLFNGLADQVAAIGKQITATSDKNAWGDIGLPKSVKGDVYLGK